MTVRVQTADFDIGAEIAALRSTRKDIGAIASFIGTVRDLNDGDAVSGMTLEHYPGMTEKALQAIVEEAQARWNVSDALIIHRVGTLTPGDQIVLVVTTSAHRGDAFAACEFLMDYLKTRARPMTQPPTAGQAVPQSRVDAFEHANHFGRRFRSICRRGLWCAGPLGSGAQAAAGQRRGNGNARGQLDRCLADRHRIRLAVAAN
jgi:molybdopterin synthase catalytic subunit